MASSNRGFALIEILIAVTIVSIVVVGIYSGISNGTVAIAQNKNMTKAIIIARTALNEFKLSNLKGGDINNTEVEGYEGFSLSREISKYENPMLGPINAKKAEITVTWEERGHKKNYTLTYVYPEL